VQTRIDYTEEGQSRERLVELYSEENKSLKAKLEEAGKAMSELNEIVNEVKDEYSKLADEKKLNENVFEAKIKENGIKTIIYIYF
jgi:arsenate reductase-like glutaredoxin family protein